MNNPVQLSDIDIKTLLEKLERAVRIRLPKKVVELALNNNVLNVRFTYPRTREIEIEPLPLKTLVIFVILFKDEETSDITAL